MEVGLIQNGMRPAQKTPAYKADVTYGTNPRPGFDYLVPTTWSARAPLACSVATISLSVDEVT